MGELKPQCEEALHEIQRFLDGELESSVTIEIEHHLSGCNPCMQRVEFRRHLKVMISSKCRGDAVPAQLDEKIRSLIRTLDIDSP
jgi:mycothiol system anti-sigma-R factor